MFEFQVAGCKFYKDNYRKDKLIPGTFVLLKDEPTNKYDPNAIMVIAVFDQDDVAHIGYVPKIKTDKVREYLSSHPGAIAYIDEVNYGSERDWCKVVISDEYGQEDDLYYEEDLEDETD